MSKPTYTTPLYPIDSQASKAISGLYATAALLCSIAIFSRAICADPDDVLKIAVKTTSISLFAGLFAGLAGLEAQKRARTYAENDTSRTHLFCIALFFCVMGAFIEEGIKPHVPNSLWVERWFVISGYLALELLGVAAVVGAMLAPADSHQRTPPSDKSFKAVVILQRLQRRWLHLDNYIEVSEPDGTGVYGFFWRGIEGTDVRLGTELNVTRRLFPNGIMSLARVEIIGGTAAPLTASNPSRGYDVAAKAHDFLWEHLIPTIFLWLIVAICYEAARQSDLLSHMTNADNAGILQEMATDSTAIILFVAAVALSAFFKLLKENVPADQHQIFRLDLALVHARNLIADAALQLWGASLVYGFFATTVAANEHPVRASFVYLGLSFLAFIRVPQSASE